MDDSHAIPLIEYRRIMYLSPGPKRGGGDKRERSREDRVTAQALQILPHLHRRLHLSPTRALFPNKNQIQAIGCQSVKVSNSFHKHE